MGFFKTKKERAESRGFKRIVKQKTTLAARQAYAEESEKVARERARAKARQPGILQSMGSFALKGAERIATPRARARPIRRVAKRKATKVSYVRRKKRKRYAPVKKATRRRVVRRKAIAPAQPRAPTSLNEAIYGGY